MSQGLIRARVEPRPPVRGRVDFHDRCDQTVPGGRRDSSHDKSTRILDSEFALHERRTVSGRIKIVNWRDPVFGARDQGHAGQRLDWQTLVAGAVERSLDWAAGD